MIFLSQSFASLHAQEGFKNLAVEQQEPADPWQQGSGPQAGPKAGHSLPDRLHPAGTEHGGQSQG